MFNVFFINYTKWFTLSRCIFQYLLTWIHIQSHISSRSSIKETLVFPFTLSNFSFSDYQWKYSRKPSIASSDQHVSRIQNQSVRKWIYKKQIWCIQDDPPGHSQLGSHYFHAWHRLFCFPGIDVSVIAAFVCFCDERTDLRTPCVKILTTFSAVAWWVKNRACIVFRNCLIVFHSLRW